MTVKVRIKNVTAEVFARILKPKVKEYGGEVSIKDNGTIEIEIDDKYKQHIIDDLTPKKD